MNEKIYLDTSIVERYFKRAALSNKKSFILPYIFHYIIRHSEIEVFISIFTLAEVFEHLWKSYKILPEDITKLTQKFLQMFNVKLIFDFHIRGEILRWVRKWKLEAKDAIHLSIARNQGLYLWTADKNLAKRGIAVYDKIKLVSKQFF